MPSFRDIELVPGVNVQKTLELNQAGVSVSQLIRYKQKLIEKYGGWSNFYPTPISSLPIRDIHAFQGLQSNQFLAVGSVGTGAAGPPSLTIISAGVLTDITPQVSDTAPTPSFSIAAGSNVVTVRELGSDEERARELARMMSGGVTPKALARARELAAQGRSNAAFREIAQPCSELPCTNS